MASGRPISGFAGLDLKTYHVFEGRKDIFYLTISNLYLKHLHPHPISMGYGRVKSHSRKCYSYLTSVYNSPLLVVVSKCLPA